MTETVPGDPARLHNAMTGPVRIPSDPQYDAARRVWNGVIDRRPAVIARCTSAEDVSAAVRFAREHNLEISVRGGAHSASGISVGDGGITIDLGLRGVTVNPRARRVRVAGGALLKDMDVATSAHRFGVPAGMVGHTGVGGLTLGGGMGWLTRQRGLSLDNVTSAEVVVADGRILRAAEDENPDLFWAIRGGGGNFGVVTTFEFRMHEIRPLIHCGWFFWDLDHTRDALKLTQELVDTTPREVTVFANGTSAPPESFVAERHHLEPCYSVTIVGFGSRDQHDSVADRIRRTVPPVAENVTELSFVALQQQGDEGAAWGQLCYEKGIRIPVISDQVATVLAECAAARTSTDDRRAHLPG